MDNRIPAVKMSGITKIFIGKVVANKDVSMEIYRGENE